MNQPVEEGIITDAKKRYGAGVLKYKQMGYWQPDYVPKDSDVVGMLRITPQEGVDSEEYGNPMFDLKDPAGILQEINACRKTFRNHYVRVTAFDSTQGVESVRMSNLVNRPKSEPGFGLVRQEVEGRQVRYTIHSYATDKGEGERY